MDYSLMDTFGLEEIPLSSAENGTTKDSSAIQLVNYSDYARYATLFSQADTRTIQKIPVLIKTRNMKFRARKKHSNIHYSELN